MGLFDKKYCDICGNKIGLLGNRKLEDGNLCKECAAKLSPWFSDRRKSSVESIRNQLDYREENKQRAAAFSTTRSYGKGMKLLIDDNHRWFTVTRATDLAAANPDILDFSQAGSCNLDIEESKREIYKKDDKGNNVSYMPRRYEYSYNFTVKIYVNGNPYFDDMDFSISEGYIKVGERDMSNLPTNGWGIRRSTGSSFAEQKYYDCINLGNDIKEAIEQMQGGPVFGNANQDSYGTFERRGAAPQPAPQQAPQQTAWFCPNCGTKNEGRFCANCGSTRD